jgi:hypothetical protein
MHNIAKCGRTLGQLRKVLELQCGQHLQRHVDYDAIGFQRSPIDQSLPSVTHGLETVIVEVHLISPGIRGWASPK